MSQDNVIERLEAVAVELSAELERRAEEMASLRKEVASNEEKVRNLAEAAVQAMLEKQRGEIVAEAEAKAKEVAESLVERPAFSAKTAPDADIKSLRAAALREVLTGRQGEAYSAYMRCVQSLYPRFIAADLSGLTSARGGVLVGPDVIAEIVKQVVDISPVRALARVLPPAAGDSFTIRRQKSSMLGRWVGRSQTPTSSGPTYGAKEIALHKLEIGTIIERELLEDANVDVMAEIRDGMAEETARLTNLAYVKGDGVSQPMGILSSTTDNANVDAFDQIPIVETPANTNAITYKLLVQMWGKLKEPYRANATWAMNTDALLEVMLLTDANGRPLWSLADAGHSVISDGSMGRLLGRPFRIFEDMDSPGDHKMALLLGDFRAGYVIRDKASGYLLVDSFSQKPDVEVTLWTRTAGDVILGEAFVVGRTT